MQLVVKSDGGNVRGIAIIRGAFVIVRRGGATRKINPVIPVGAASGDAEASCSGMRWQLAPFNLIGIFMINLAQPALVRSHVTRTTRRARLGAIYDYNCFVSHAPGHAEGGSAGERRGLSPSVFFNVVNLHVVHRATEGSAANQINETVVNHAGDRTIDGNGDVFTARPAACAGLIDVYIWNRQFKPLVIHHIAAHEDDQSLCSAGGGIQTAHRSGNRAAVAPFPCVCEGHYIDLVRNIIPGLFRADPHEGKKFEAAFEAGDGVA
jgi:hypothetical protein